MQYTGPGFNSVAGPSGERLGVVNWGEEVTYDNVRVEDLALVSEPVTFGLLPLALAVIGARRARRRCS